VRVDGAWISMPDYKQYMRDGTPALKKSSTKTRRSDAAAPPKKRRSDKPAQPPKKRLSDKPAQPPKKRLSDQPAQPPKKRRSDKPAPPPKKRRFDPPAPPPPPAPPRRRVAVASTVGRMKDTLTSSVAEQVKEYPHDVELSFLMYMQTCDRSVPVPVLRLPQGPSAYVLDGYELYAVLTPKQSRGIVLKSAHVVGPWLCDSGEGTPTTCIAVCHFLICTTALTFMEEDKYKGVSLEIPAGLGLGDWGHVRVHDDDEESGGGSE